MIKTGLYTYNGEEKQFSFKTSLSAHDKMKFVSSVTNLVVGENYYSILKDLFFDFAIINVFTDVSIRDRDDEEIEYTVDIVESLVNDTEIVNIVKANLDYGVIEELKEAVNDNIEYKTGIHRNPLTESLSNLVNTIDKQLSGINVDSLMEFANIFSGMTGELTPEKMLKVYSESDLFKNKYNEVLENKKKHNDKIDELIEEVNSTILH